MAARLVGRTVAQKRLSNEGMDRGRPAISAPRVATQHQDHAALNRYLNSVRAVLYSSFAVALPGGVVTDGC